MTIRVDLPGDAWAVLREPSELTNRHRKMLRRAALPAYKIRGKFGTTTTVEVGDPDDTGTVFDRVDADDLDRLSDMQAAYIVAYIVEWSLDRPLPTADTVDDLDAAIFDALAKATTAQGMGGVTIDVDEAVDPASPTVPSPA